VRLELERLPVGLAAEVVPALTEQPGTRDGPTRPAGFVEPDGGVTVQRSPLAPYTSTAFMFIRPMLSQPSPSDW